MNAVATTQQVEAAAKALYKRNGLWSFRDGRDFTWDEIEDDHRQQFLDDARAALEVVAALPKSDEEQRWDTGIDWLLNQVNQNDFTEPFFAFADGLITEKELRAESVSVETIVRRRARAEDKAAADLAANASRP
jgi:hypothetical protein